jgi:hypothetical protein
VQIFSGELIYLPKEDQKLPYTRRGNGIRISKNEGRIQRKLERQGRNITGQGQQLSN